MIFDPNKIIVVPFLSPDIYKWAPIHTSYFPILFAQPHFPAQMYSMLFTRY